MNPRLCQADDHLKHMHVLIQDTSRVIIHRIEPASWHCQMID